MSFPFLAVRLSYACAWLFEGFDEWNPLVGSIAALVCMHSVTEYTVVLIGLFTAFSIPSGREEERRETDDDGFKDVFED
jgi:ABC-type Fe3+ transport system permease subunit